MDDHERIQQYVRDVLAGSGLAVERRKDVAEELTQHLEQRIQERQSEGLPRRQAVDSALEAFGSPAILRRQLKRQQGQQDHVLALRELRKSLRRIILASSMFLIIILWPADEPLFSRFLAGIPLFFWVSFWLVASVYMECRCKYQLRRGKPRSEFVFMRTLVKRLAAGSILYLLAITSALLTVNVRILLINGNPAEGLRDFWLMPYSFLQAILELPQGFLGHSLFALLLVSLILAFYERHHCVKESITDMEQ